MTTQIPDVIILGRKKHSMASLPLEVFREAGGKLPDTRALCSALWRGYEATWAVRRGRLYLVSVDTSRLNKRKMTLKHFFPGWGEPVFAQWFSEKIRIPQGERIMALRGSVCGGIHEQDLYLTFERGVLVNREVKKNVVMPELRAFFSHDYE